MRVRWLAAVVLVLAAACGGGSGKPFNAADVSFAQSMIPHHEQAVTMAAMAASQAENPKVKDLAARIQAAQAPEIQQMTGWLQSWQQPLTMPAGHGDMGHGMAGMMDESQMDQLQTAMGSQFDRLFLTMMTQHHQGAVTMAQTETDKGKFADAKQLASSIITAQQAEIQEMQQLLAAG